MPICFKCGKDLATDQSLQYHLQKRVKCNTLNCSTCKKQFPNKLLLDNHKHECNYTSNTLSRYDIFDQIQSKQIYLIELDKAYDVKYISENFENELHLKKSDIINKNINNLIRLDSILNKCLANTEVEHNEKKFDVSIKYNADNILLVETLVS